MIIKVNTPEGNKPWKVFVNDERAYLVSYVNDETNEYLRWVENSQKTFYASRIVIDPENLTIHIEDQP